MTQILPSASYLRTPHSSDTHSEDIVLFSICEHSGLGSPDVSRRVWDLLETPQTVATICRTLASEHRVERSDCDQEVKSFLAELYHEDLIQLSPDS